MERERETEKKRGETAEDRQLRYKRKKRLE
jgi:hypothetical protein